MKYNTSKASHNEYMKKLKAWEDKYGSGEDTSTPKDEPKEKETPKKTRENVPTPKRMLNMVSMRAELQKKKEVVKERDEHREQQNKGTEMQVWNNVLRRIRRIKVSPDPIYLVG